MGKCIMNRYLIKVDEDLIKSFIKIQKNFNWMYGCSLEVFDTMEKPIQDLYEGTVANMDMNKLSHAMQDAFPNRMSMMNYDSVIAVGVKLSDAVSIYATHAEQSHQLSKIDFSPIFIRQFIHSDFFKDSINIAYEMTRKEFDQTGDNINESGSGLSDMTELEDDVNECIHCPESFREKFTAWSLKRKILYCKINQILCFICACFIQPYIQGNISLPVMALKAKNVRMMPQVGSEVICQMKENTEAIILEDTIHYFRIAFIDDIGIKREGYVAKNGLKLLNV